MKSKTRQGIKLHSRLTPGMEYEIVGITWDKYRVLDDHGEPILYPKTMFVLLFTAEDVPHDWVWRHYEDGEYFADPPGIGGKGFWERYFDDDPEAVRSFQKYMASRADQAMDESSH